MATHLCEVLIRDTKETVKFYEIELPDEKFNLWSLPTWYKARQKAVDQFNKDLQYTPALKKKVNGRDWCIDSIVI